MILRLALCLLIAAPAGALTLDTLQGRWRGEGDLLAEGWSNTRASMWSAPRTPRMPLRRSAYEV